MATSPCRTCSQEIEEQDNFCRGCGTPSGAMLPVRRQPGSMTIWRPHASPVVKGAAVMAAGTIGQFLFRRALRGVLTSAPRRPHRRARGADGLFDEAHIITETVMLRRVRILRRA